ncbi:MAG: isoprenylcysteine carboxylmethyltransferase family protein [Ignavibacteriales bacterium]|nr:MAG: isoprenylcysteine carboxylmethyltransferase family protein [Ignavibacteriales bacterium]
MNVLMEHFGQWGAVIFFIIVYGIAILFIPFYKKMERKPAFTYLAFVIAFAIEMHGIPFSMLLISSILGRSLPEGILWGHTMIDYVGYMGLYLNIGFALAGMLMIIFGWYQIYHGYWKKVDGSGHIVSDGMYKYIRHPQYTGLILIALGMVLGWATLTNLIMLPIIIYMYYRLSLREEKHMIEEFGDAYIIYMKHTKRFIPWII